MELIFHEKQEGSLCAQHCLNALLQGPYFTPVELAELAQTLDESERQHMAEGGFGTQEYQQFIAQPSSNYDDSGFFSIQVLQQALSVWNLELVPLTSSLPVCGRFREDPKSAQAYVCNFREHWLTIRRLGYQWFNLNSLLTGPELLSDTYLMLFIKQLQHDGYSIFVVIGDLPSCEANDHLLLISAVQPTKPRLISDVKRQSSSDSILSPRQGGGGQRDDDMELQRALAESRRLDEEQDESLKKALELSMMGFECSSAPLSTSEAANTSSSNATIQPTPIVQQPDLNEIRRRRLEKFEAGSGPQSSSSSNTLAELAGSHSSAKVQTESEQQSPDNGKQDNRSEDKKDEN